MLINFKIILFLLIKNEIPLKFLEKVKKQKFTSHDQKKSLKEISQMYCADFGLYDFLLLNMYENFSLSLKQEFSCNF